MNTVISDNEMKRRVGANLTALLKERGMSEYALKELINSRSDDKVSAQTLANICRGEHQPKVGLLARIADAIEVEIGDIIAETRKRPRSAKSFRKVG